MNTFWKICAFILLASGGNTRAQVVVLAKDGDAIQNAPPAILALSGGLSETNASPNEIFFVGAAVFNGNDIRSGVFRAGPAPNQVRAVMLSQQATPTNNGNFESSGVSQIAANANGMVAFQSTLIGTLGGSQDDEGIFVQSASTGTLREIVRKGQLIPGGGPRFRNLLLLDVTANDLVFFHDDGTSALWKATAAGALTRITPTSIVVPDTDPGDLFTTINTAERVGFFGNGFSGVNLWSASNPADAVIRVQTGALSPNGNGNYSSITTVSPITANGSMAFRSLLSNTSGGAADDRGVFRSTSQGTFELVRKGQFTPSNNGRYLNPGRDAPILMNNAGEVAFLSEISGAAVGFDYSLFVGNGSTTREVVRVGMPAPGGGTFFNSFGNIDLRPLCFSEAGELIFYAVVSINQQLRPGLFLEKSGVKTRILAVGDNVAPIGSVAAFQTSLSNGRLCNRSGQLVRRVIGGSGHAIVVWQGRFGENVFANGFEN